MSDRLSVEQIAQELIPLHRALLPDETLAQQKAIRRVLTHDGKVQLEQTAGFLPRSSIAQDALESGTLVDLNFPSIADGGVEALVVTVPGAELYDTVSIGLDPSYPDTLPQPVGIVTAIDEVTIRIRNNSGGAVNPPSLAFRISLSR